MLQMRQDFSLPRYKGDLMKKEQMDKLLGDAVVRFYKLKGLEPTKAAMKRLPTETAYKEVQAKESDAFLNARNALMESGLVTEENRDAGIVEGIVYAGVANMNPAVVVICVEDSTIRICAYAKEGLIKQHTAEKAIEKYIRVL